MRRALQLARCGRLDTSPNPMVGAVIVARGKIIGEGYHRKCGGPHAEVNAVASVLPDDRPLLSESTIYVTLEPCSHYGKTPPCALLLRNTGFKRVVVGCLDPFEKVSGRGVELLRQAGIEVTVGVLEEECKALNSKFFTAHTHRRPYVTLKWAQSADGYIDHRRTDQRPCAARFSTDISSLEVQLIRATHDAIMVGADTVLADNPRLTVRTIDGHSPLRVVLDRRGRCVSQRLNVYDGSQPTLWVTSASAPIVEFPDGVERIEVAPYAGIESVLTALYQRGCTSLLVEGGATLLQAFIDSGLWDETRIETSPTILGADGSVKAPRLPFLTGITATECDGNTIIKVKNEC